MVRAITLGAILILALAGPVAAVGLTPLTLVGDELGFGTLYDSLSVSYTGGDFTGTMESRVYVDALPASQVTFVFDLQVTLAATGVWDLAIAATGVQDDLRIMEIIAGENGCVTGTTTNIPDNADAYNNTYPVADELIYGWLSGNEIVSDGRAIMYVTTTGAVDVGQVGATIQDGGVANVMVLAPVDNPDTPDLSIPEPATISLLALGGMAMLRRRRH